MEQQTVPRRLYSVADFDRADDTFTYTIGSATVSSWVISEWSGVAASPTIFPTGRCLQSSGGTIDSLPLAITTGDRRLRSAALLGVERHLHRAEQHRDVVRRRNACAEDLQHLEVAQHAGGPVGDDRRPIVFGRPPPAAATSNASASISVRLDRARRCSEPRRLQVVRVRLTDCKLNARSPQTRPTMAFNSIEIDFNVPARRGCALHGLLPAVQRHADERRAVRTGWRVDGRQRWLGRSSPRQQQLLTLAKSAGCNWIYSGAGPKSTAGGLGLSGAHWRRTATLARSRNNAFGAMVR